MTKKAFNLLLKPRLISQSVWYPKLHSDVPDMLKMVGQVELSSVLGHRFEWMHVSV